MFDCQSRLWVCPFFFHHHSISLISVRFLDQVTTDIIHYETKKVIDQLMVSTLLDAHTRLSLSTTLGISPVSWKNTRKLNRITRSPLHQSSLLSPLLDLWWVFGATHVQSSSLRTVPLHTQEGRLRVCTMLAVHYPCQGNTLPLPKKMRLTGLVVSELSAPMVLENRRSSSCWR